MPVLHLWRTFTGKICFSGMNCNPDPTLEEHGTAPHTWVLHVSPTTASKRFPINQDQLTKTRQATSPLLRSHQLRESTFWFCCWSCPKAPKGKTCQIRGQANCSWLGKRIPVPYTADGSRHAQLRRAVSESAMLVVKPSRPGRRRRWWSEIHSQDFKTKMVLPNFTAVQFPLNLVTAPRDGPNGSLCEKSRPTVFWCLATVARLGHCNKYCWTV